MEKSHKPTANEQALTALRHDVLTLAYAPGTKLKLDQLQQDYGLSSSPLREALNRLAEEGLVRADERRGFKVAAVSEDDLRDITRMRLLVDLPALQESMQHGGDEWEARVVASFYRLEKVEARLSDGPVVLDREWSSLHRAFHFSMLSACPSERLGNNSRSLFDQAERYRHISARYRSAVKRKSDEHKLLMRAVLKRDVATACSMHEEHVLGTQKNALKALALWSKNVPDTH